MPHERRESHLTELAVALHARRSPAAVLAVFAEAVPELADRPGIELVDGALTIATDAVADEERELWARRAEILEAALATPPPTTPGRGRRRCCAR
jgi:hypothetical protein